MNRKDTLRELLTSPKASVAPIEADQIVIEGAHTERASSGAVRTMGLSLQKLSAEAETGRALRLQLAAGTNVVELDTELIEPSFVSDRISQPEDEAFEDLVKSIASHGQQVPILVRPHSQTPGRFQIAYGHRRLRAAIALHLKVRAVVREMSDTEVVIAQGKENSERRDLTFIERALFALHLEEAGFDRNIIIAALSVDKTEVVRLLSVARAIPGEVIYAVGPAPKAGRPRWMELAELVAEKTSRPLIDKLLGDPEFRSADTDARFSKLFGALAGRKMARRTGAAAAWQDPKGRPVVRIQRIKEKTIVSFNEKLAPKFGAFVLGKLDELYRAFSSAHPGDTTG
jgi:ParB family transcriptional regulator, chromosome partitioning protein